MSLGKLEGEWSSGKNRVDVAFCLKWIGRETSKEGSRMDKDEGNSDVIQFHISSDVDDVIRIFGIWFGDVLSVQRRYGPTSRLKKKKEKGEEDEKEKNFWKRRNNLK